MQVIQLMTQSAALSGKAARFTQVLGFPSTPTCRLRWLARTLSEVISGPYKAPIRFLPRRALRRSALAPPLPPKPKPRPRRRQDTEQLPRRLPPTLHHRNRSQVKRLRTPSIRKRSDLLRQSHIAKIESQRSLEPLGLSIKNTSGSGSQLVQQIASIFGQSGSIFAGMSGQQRIGFHDRPV